MSKTKSMRMQEMAHQSECLGAISVERIGDDRMTNGGQMDANLVHHAGFHRDFEQSRFTRLREAAITRARIPSSCFCGRRSNNRLHPARIVWVVGQRQIDLAR